MSADSYIFRADRTNSKKSKKEQAARRALIPAAPPWRVFTKEGKENRGRGFVLPRGDKTTLEVVNAALCLRRPILVEGGPGLGKTTLAYAVAYELGLLGPFRWGITSRTQARDGLYLYDAIGRLQAAHLAREKRAGSTEKTELPPIGEFLRLGPLGMGFHRSRPQQPAVVLIDEIDKGDQDLPNDLLHHFEEGYFDIPEIQRMRLKEAVEVLPADDGAMVKIPATGRVTCQEFPLIVMTSNGERSFPGPFLRRCLRLKLELLKGPELHEHLRDIIKERFGAEGDRLEAHQSFKPILAIFEELQATGNYALSVDQMLNAMHLLLRGDDVSAPDREALKKQIFANLLAS